MSTASLYPQADPLTEADIDLMILISIYTKDNSKTLQIHIKIESTSISHDHTQTSHPHTSHVDVTCRRSCTPQISETSKVFWWTAERPFPLSTGFRTTQPSTAFAIHIFCCPCTLPSIFPAFHFPRPSYSLLFTLFTIHLPNYPSD